MRRFTPFAIVLTCLAAGCVDSVMSLGFGGFRGMQAPPPPPGPGPSPTPSAAPVGTTTSVPPIYKKFAATVIVSMDGASVKLVTNDVPNHKSPYFGVGNAMYEMPYSGMSVNPNTITSQNYVFRVPANPAFAAAISATPLDAIGMAVNGVVMFNQYAAGYTALTNEIVTFDAHNGHPAPHGNYHYHMEPSAITNNDANLVGVMLDGFPLYGRKDANGTTPPNLDAANGHFGATADYPNGIYHYHVTAAVPYLCGGFKGTAGTVTN